ncbi:MAG: hypothetical protein AAGA68_18880 [Pseudomonadota bacterium]
MESIRTRAGVPESLLLIMGLAFAVPAHAYVGPGAGLSLLGALWGLLVAVVAAVGFIVFWPIRKMLRTARADARSPDASDRDDP